jgi:hypothetical protein
LEKLVLFLRLALRDEAPAEPPGATWLLSSEDPEEARSDMHFLIHSVVVQISSPLDIMTLERVQQCVQ